MIALTLAREFIPNAITLDIALPDMAGWTILDRLKHDPATRHIPVHVISGDENRRRGLALGAMTYLEKTVTKDNLIHAFDTIHHSLEPRTRKLLIVSSEEPRLAHWRAMLGGRVQKAEQNVTLTTNLIKKFLGLRLSPEERRVEQAYARGRNGE